jgi:hypothetical protein
MTVNGTKITPGNEARDGWKSSVSLHVLLINFKDTVEKKSTSFFDVLVYGLR